ncbi:putative GATA transcription factor 22 [Ricinus communis]|nr:putative GATA transcription factor 22 [Ricinus communis]
MASRPLLLLLLLQLTRPLTLLIRSLLALVIHYTPFLLLSIHTYIYIYIYIYCPSFTRHNRQSLFFSLSMTPIYDLNQPSSSFTLVERKDDQQLQLFLSPHHHAAASFSGPTFFNTPHQDHTGSSKPIGDSSHQHDHKVDKYIAPIRSSDHRPLSSSSSLQAAVNCNIGIHKLPPFKREDEDYQKGSGDESSKWMPSKMRIMQKMMNSNCFEFNDKPVKFTVKFQDHQQYQATNNEINSSCSNGNNNIRVCSDCNTTTTPLWRSGPRGPKSLCNACGIRQRKARRAMAAAAAIAMETSSTKAAKVKEKKSRTGHASQCKKLCKPPDHPPPPYNQGQKPKVSFKNLALSLSNNSALQRVFPEDVEEAATLLMELSCGFIHG